MFKNMKSIENLKGRKYHILAHDGSLIHKITINFITSSIINFYDEDSQTYRSITSYRVSEDGVGWYPNIDLNNVV